MFLHLQDAWHCLDSQALSLGQTEGGAGTLQAVRVRRAGDGGGVGEPGKGLRRKSQ